MNEKGLTIVETLVVMVLIGIILSFTVPFTLGMIRKARAETQIRNLYGNLTEARQRSVERSLPYVVQVTGTAGDTDGVGSAITVFEDKDSDGPDASEKVDILSWAPTAAMRTPAYSLAGTVGGVSIATVQEIDISTRGIMTPDATIYLNPRSGDNGVSEAVVNCVNISITRVGLGKLDLNNVCCVGVIDASSHLCT